MAASTVQVCSPGLSRRPHPLALLSFLWRTFFTGGQELGGTVKGRERTHQQLELVQGVVDESHALSKLHP